MCYDIYSLNLHCIEVCIANYSIFTNAEGYNTPVLRTLQQSVETCFQNEMKCN